MKKYLFISLITLLSIDPLKSQQLPLYTQYMINDYIINPAVGGKIPYFEAKSTYRYQWVGITDAPRTYILSINGPVQGNNVGVGGYLLNDVTGPTRRTGVYGSYAYHLKLNESMKLSLGLSGGVLQYVVDGSKIILHDAVGDDALKNGMQSVLLPDFGFGAYFYDNSYKYYAGISAPQLLQNRVRLYDKTTATLSKLTTHVFITGGYKHDLNDDIIIEPSTLIKLSQSTPFQIDVGVRATYQKQISLGVFYRTKDAISIMAGYTYKDYLSVAYAYDITTSNIGKYSSGAHEIMLGMKFK